MSISHIRILWLCYSKTRGERESTGNYRNDSNVAILTNGKFALNGRPKIL